MTADTPHPVDPSPPAPAVQVTEARLLELLVCPLTKGPLTYDRAAQELISPKADVAYPIRNGVPVLTQEAARSLNPR